MISRNTTSRKRRSAAEKGRHAYCAEVSSEKSYLPDGRNYHSSHIPIRHERDVSNELGSRSHTVDCERSQYNRGHSAVRATASNCSSANRTKVNTASDAISESHLSLYTVNTNADTHSTMVKSGSINGRVTTPKISSIRSESPVQAIVENATVDNGTDTLGKLPLEKLQTFMRHTKDTLFKLTDCSNVEWDVLDQTLRQASKGVAELAKEWKQNRPSDGVLTISPAELTDLDITVSDSQLIRRQLEYVGNIDSRSNVTETTTQGLDDQFISTNMRDEIVGMRQTSRSVRKRRANSGGKHSVVVLVKSDLQSWLSADERIALTKSNCNITAANELEEQDQDFYDVLLPTDNMAVHSREYMIKEDLNTRLVDDVSTTPLHEISTSTKCLERKQSNSQHNTIQQKSTSDTIDAGRKPSVEQPLSVDMEESNELAYKQLDRIRSLEAILEAERCSVRGLTEDLEFEHRCSSELLVQHQRAIEQSLRCARRELACKELMRHHEQEIYSLNIIVITLFASGCFIAFCFVLS